MNEVALRWYQTSLSSLTECPVCNYYCLARGGNILYIGIADKTTVNSEVRNTLRRFNIKPIGLAIYIGYIEESTYDRVTGEIIRDAECLLIYTHQPTHNSHCKKIYTGRDNLRVRNWGVNPLRPCVECVNGTVYLTCSNRR